MVTSTLPQLGRTADGPGCATRPSRSTCAVRGRAGQPAELDPSPSPQGDCSPAGRGRQHRSSGTSVALPEQRKCRLTRQFPVVRVFTQTSTFGGIQYGIRPGVLWPVDTHHTEEARRIRVVLIQQPQSPQPSYEILASDGSTGLVGASVSAQAGRSFAQRPGPPARSLLLSGAGGVAASAGYQLVDAALRYPGRRAQPGRYPGVCAGRGRNVRSFSSGGPRTSAACGGRVMHRRSAWARSRNRLAITRTAMRCSSPRQGIVVRPVFDAISALAMLQALILLTDPLGLSALRHPLAQRDASRRDHGAAISMSRVPSMR